MYSNNSVNNISLVSVSILIREDYPLFVTMLQGKCCVQSNLYITVSLEKWVTAIYIYIYRFPFNSTWYWVHSTLVVPPFDCHEKVNWFHDLASIHFSVYFGAHILNFILTNIPEKITQFWLAEKGVRLFRNTSAKCVTRVQTCNTSANYKCFLIDWKHKRNHQEPIRLELFNNTDSRKWPWFSADDDGIKFCKQNNNRKVKKIFQKPEHRKNKSFWLNVLKMRC